MNDASVNSVSVQESPVVSGILDPENIAPYRGSRTSFNTWIREQIWGHRIHDTSKYHLFLEFLNVAEACYREDREKLFRPIAPDEQLCFTPRRSLLLRNLLFNNPTLTHDEHRMDEGEAGWDRWSEEFTSRAELAFMKFDLSYLKDRFTSFRAFCQHCHLLQQLTLDAEKAPRWTSRFIFPIGPEAMYVDLGANLQRDRTRFTRTGEIAYLMLCRSSVATKLRDAFESFLSAKGEKNALLTRLLPEDKPDVGQEASESPYLPYHTHPSFDRMGEDVLKILELKLPDQDAFEFLIPMLAFHILLYHQETARAWTGKGGLGTLVCEVVAPRSDQVRRASLASFADNHGEGILALEKATECHFANEEICRILGNEHLSKADKAQEILDLISDPSDHEHFIWNEKGREFAFNDVEELKKHFLSSARAGYAAHTGKVPLVLGRECGLVSKRATRSYRYAPTDSFLRMLVVTNVSERIELASFLGCIYQRYGIVIDEEIGAETIDREFFNQNAFRRNRQRLLHRLSSMGLARQMSDGCTYIENPFYQSGQVTAKL